MTPEKEHEQMYLEMLRRTYNQDAMNWSLTNRNPVVGSFDAHNEWADYEHLFTRLKDQKNKVGLDFACGPGRNLVRYKGRFKRLDGVDISPINIGKATEYLLANGVSAEESQLFVSNGNDLGFTHNSYYDFVMSTIALQHICVHEIRFSIMAHIHEALKPGGLFTAQMGYGIAPPGKRVSTYYENNYSAQHSNGHCDVEVTSATMLQDDLVKIGFVDFDYILGERGPGDNHAKWIYFSAFKPL